MRVMVIGHTGCLGKELMEAGTVRGWDMVASWVPEKGEFCDIRNPLQVQQAFDYARKPDAVINCAAIHDLKECNDRPYDAWDVNANGALNVAQCCQAAGVTMIHISTDYVFGGDNTWVYAASDNLCPTKQAGVYGYSKAAAEYAVKAACEKTMIVRTASLFGKHPSIMKHGRPNIVDYFYDELSAGHEVVAWNNTSFSMGYAPYVAGTILSNFALSSGYYYPMHAVCYGVLNHADLAYHIAQRFAHGDGLVTGMNKKDAIRAALKATPIDGNISWQEAVDKYIDEKESH